MQDFNPSKKRNSDNNSQNAIPPHPPFPEMLAAQPESKTIINSTGENDEASNYI